MSKHVTTQRSWTWGWCFAWTGVLVFLLSFPTVYLILWSFWGTSTRGVLAGFTVAWFIEVLQSKEWWGSFAYSVCVAGVAAVISAASVVCYFYFSMWGRRKYQSLAFFLLLGPIFVPTVIYALAIRTMFNTYGFPEWLILVVGNVTLLLPIEYFLLESANEFVKDEWIYSAATLGATHLENIRYILLPTFRRPIIWVLVIGFLISFDEIVVASFVIDGPTATVPKRLWDAIGTTMKPTPAVVGILMLGFVGSSIMIARKLSQLSLHSILGEVNAIRNFLVQLRKTASVGRDAVILLVIAVALRLLLIPHVSLQASSSEIRTDLLLFFLASPWPILCELLEYRQVLGPVVARRGRDRRAGTHLEDFFLERRLSAFDEDIGLAFREGVVLSPRDLDSFCLLCFEKGKGIYQGTDSNPPGMFMKLYPYYLGYHETNQKKQMEPGIRLLLVSLDALQADYKENRRDFDLFYEWHLKNTIDLFQVDPVDAQQRARSYGLPWTDLGIWDNDYIISFLPVSTDQIKIAIHSRDSEKFDRSRSYFLSLLDLANEITLHNSVVHCSPIDAGQYKERTSHQWQL